MKKILFIIGFLGALLTANAQIGQNPTTFNYGIRLPNASNEVATDSIPVIDGNGVIQGYITKPQLTGNFVHRDSVQYNVGISNTDPGKQFAPIVQINAQGNPFWKSNGYQVTQSAASNSLPVRNGSGQIEVNAGTDPDQAVNLGQLSDSLANTAANIDLQKATENGKTTDQGIDITNFASLGFDNGSDRFDISIGEDGTLIFVPGTAPGDTQIANFFSRVSGYDASQPQNFTTLKQVQDSIAALEGDIGANYIPLSQKGAANGVSTLGPDMKIPMSQVPDALIGSVNYQGNWNPTTNTPTLPATPGSETKGHYYIVSTSGTWEGEEYNNGDWIISNGIAWGKVDNNNKVVSVNSLTGPVQLDPTFSNGQLGITGSSTVNLDSRYYTETETDNFLSAKANNNEVVHLTGDETISGVKTFAQPLLSSYVRPNGIDGTGGSGNIISTGISQSGDRTDFPAASTNNILTFKLNNSRTLELGSGISVSQGLWYRPLHTANNNPWTRVWDSYNLPSPANDNNVIHTTGDETKAGLLTLNSGATGLVINRSAGTQNSIQFTNQNGTAHIGLRIDGKFGVGPDANIQNTGVPLATESWVGDNYVPYEISNNLNSVTTGLYYSPGSADNLPYTANAGGMTISRQEGGRTPQLFVGTATDDVDAVFWRNTIGQTWYRGASREWVNSQGFLTSPSTLQESTTAGATTNVTTSFLSGINAGTLSTQNIGTGGVGGSFNKYIDIDFTAPGKIQAFSPIVGIAAENENEVLTGENAGFGLNWNDADNVLDWGEVIDAGGAKYITVPSEVNELLYMGQFNATTVGNSGATLYEGWVSDPDQAIAGFLASIDTIGRAFTHMGADTYGTFMQIEMQDEVGASLTQILLNHRETPNAAAVPLTLKTIESSTNNVGIEITSSNGQVVLQGNGGGTDPDIRVGGPVGMHYVVDNSANNTGNDLWIPNKKYVDDAVEAVTPTTGAWQNMTITGDATATTARCRKRGNVVEIEMIDAVRNSGGFTLPAGFEPTIDLHTFSGVNTTTGAAARISIQTSGNITIWNTLTDEITFTYQYTIMD